MLAPAAESAIAKGAGEVAKHMWPFRRARELELWEHFPARPEHAVGSLTDDQREFIFWALETSPLLSPRERKEVRRMYDGAKAAGHQAMADNYLGYSLSLNGNNLHRSARDPAYWEEFQRVMIGRRVDLVSFIVGKTVPINDKRPWRSPPSRE